jgi:hypothetical protein
MASKDRQAEETRIRRALEINSFDLTTLKHHLMENDCIPDSSDEQAARDAAFRFRKNYTVNTSPVGANLRNGLFAASENAFELDSDACVRESESVKYDAVRDFILMLAVRKAQTSAAQQQKDSRGSYAVVKQERA